MPKKSSPRGQDRARVAGRQDYEMRYASKKTLPKATGRVSAKSLRAIDDAVKIYSGALHRLAKK